MGYSTGRAVLEGQLAIAHRALWRAMMAASELDETTTVLDLEQIAAEVTRLAEASLRNKPGRRESLKGQQQLC